MCSLLRRCAKRVPSLLAYICIVPSVRRSQSLRFLRDLGVTTCHFCRRADLCLYFTCTVCQLTTHAKCYYRLGSDEAAYYETNTSDWRCQDCGGPQRHADCAISDDGQGIQRQAGQRPSNSGHAALGMPSEDYTLGSDSHDSCIVQQHSKKPRRQQAKKHKHPQGIRPPRPKETKRN